MQPNVGLNNSINHSFEGLSERIKTIPQQLPCKTVSCVLKYPATWENQRHAGLRML
jgi:hypothetical protein